MGTHKTTKRAFSTTRSIPTTDPTTKRHAKGRKQASSKDVPGVQKVKAALRQTKRLLAKVQYIYGQYDPELTGIGLHKWLLHRSTLKEDLAADVRNATERRLKSLEGDLAEAELARTERSMALRYHKVGGPMLFVGILTTFDRSNSSVSCCNEIGRQLKCNLQNDKRCYGKFRGRNECWRAA